MDLSADSWNLEVKATPSSPSSALETKCRDEDTAAARAVSSVAAAECNEGSQMRCALLPGPARKTQPGQQDQNMLTPARSCTSGASPGSPSDENAPPSVTSRRSTKEGLSDAYVEALQEAGRYALWAPLLHEALFLEGPSLLLGQIRFDVTAEDQRGSWLLPEELLTQQSGPSDEDGDDRQVFTNTPITEEEQQAIDEILLQFLELQKQEDAENTTRQCRDALLGVQPVWLEQLVLRYLYSCSFDRQKAFDLLQSTLAFRTQQLPVLESEVYHELRNMGACYWHGRDRRMRPLLIISLQRLQQLQREAAAEEKVTRLVIFCLEFFLRYLCVAGVVENWCILCDLNGTSISSFPLPLLLRLMQLIQGSYRGRLYRFYILYAPRLFHFIAKPLVSSLPTTTAKKLRVFTSLDDWYQERRTQFAAHQLEKKYGGTASDITEHWYPFRFFPGPFEPECEAGCSGLKKMDVRWESEQALHAKVHPLVHTGASLHTSLVWRRSAEKESPHFRYAAWLRHLRELHLAPATVEWARCMLSSRLQVHHDSLVRQVVHQGDATEFSKAQNSPAETSKEACSSSGLSLTNNTGGIEAVEEGQNRSKKAAGIFPYGAGDAVGRCWETPLGQASIFSPRLQVQSPEISAQSSLGEAGQAIYEVPPAPSQFFSADRREPPLAGSPPREERPLEDSSHQIPSGHGPQLSRNRKSPQLTSWGTQGTAGRASASAQVRTFGAVDGSSVEPDTHNEDICMLGNSTEATQPHKSPPRNCSQRNQRPLCAATGGRHDGNNVGNAEAPFYPSGCSSCVRMPGQQEHSDARSVPEPAAPPPLQHPRSPGSLGGTCRTVSLSASGPLERALGSPANTAWQNAPSCEQSLKWSISACKSLPSFPCDASAGPSKAERAPCVLLTSPTQGAAPYSHAAAAIKKTADLQASVGHPAASGLHYTKFPRAASELDAGRMCVQGSSHFLSPVAAEPSPSVSICSLTGSSRSETCLVCEDLSSFQGRMTSRTNEASNQTQGQEVEGQKGMDTASHDPAAPAHSTTHVNTSEEQPRETAKVLTEHQASRVVELRRLKRVMRALYSSVSGTRRRSENKQQMDHYDVTPETTRRRQLYRRYARNKLQNNEKVHQLDRVEPEKCHRIGLRRRLSRRLLPQNHLAAATPSAGAIPKPAGKRRYRRRVRLYLRGSGAILSTRFSFQESSLRSNRSDCESYVEATSNARTPSSFSASRGTSKRFIRLPICFSDRVRRGTLVLARSMHSKTRRSGTI